MRSRVQKVTDDYSSVAPQHAIEAIKQDVIQSKNEKTGARQDQYASAVTTLRAIFITRLTLKNPVSVCTALVLGRYNRMTKPAGKEKKVNPPQKINGQWLASSDMAIYFQATGRVSGVSGTSEQQTVALTQHAGAQFAGLVEGHVEQGGQAYQPTSSGGVG